MGYKILTIIIGGLSAALLALISHTIKNSVIDLSSRNMFGFGLSGLLYFLLPAYFFFLGLLLSAIVFHIKSLPISLAVSMLVSLAVSWKTINAAKEIYRRPDYFDKAYFYSDIFEICATFIIFPLVCILIFVLREKYLTAI